MKLLSLQLSGFRGFPQRRTFDLDADAVVVVGANGNGKTSLFDAVLWALSGLIPRLKSDDARLVSMYSETGQATVELRLKDTTTGNVHTLTRSFDGQERQITLQTSDNLYQGPLAEGKIIDLVWPTAASASSPREALASVLTRCVYLQQDLVRQFLEVSSDQERFEAFSELVGAGRVTELQASLERAKKAWTGATNQRQVELRPAQERLIRIETRLSELTARGSKAQPATTSEGWTQWWQRIAALDVPATHLEPTSREASSAIDSAVKQLDARRRSEERRVQALKAAQAEIADLAKRQMPDATTLRDKATAARKELEDGRRAVSEEQTRLTELRRAQAAIEEKNEQLKMLAAIALRHLEEVCPVCAQTYNKEETRRRLEGMAKAGGIDVQAPSAPDRLNELLASLAAKENESTQAESSLRSAEQGINERLIAQQTLSKRLTDLGVRAGDEASRNAALEKAIAEAEEFIQRATELQGIGESLALNMAQSSAVAAMDELRREADSLRRENAKWEKIIAARNRTGERAQRVIEALRETTSTMVEERLNEITPLLQSIYSRMEPHPAFRLVTFLSRIVRGRGQLSTRVSDPVEDKQCENPAAVFSSSQVNALAISVFLTLNIGVPTLPLSVAILDDPLQSLDDINLLGLVDLLRRAKDQRQLLVSTHDTRFGELLARKLRPRDKSGRTIVIELDGWSRRGPSVETREIKCDPVPLRLVGARAG